MRSRLPLALGVVVAAFGVALSALMVSPLAHATPVLLLGWGPDSAGDTNVHTDPGVGYRFAA